MHISVGKLNKLNIESQQLNLWDNLLILDLHLCSIRSEWEKFVAILLGSYSNIKRIENVVDYSFLPLETERPTELEQFFSRNSI